jgi:hypothetical protein
MENTRDVAVLAGGDVGEAHDLHINTTGLLPIPLGVRNFSQKKTFPKSTKKVTVAKENLWIR